MALICAEYCRGGILQFNGSDISPTYATYCGMGRFRILQNLHWIVADIPAQHKGRIHLGRVKVKGALHVPWKSFEEIGNLQQRPLRSRDGHETQTCIIPKWRDNRAR